MKIIKYAPLTLSLLLSQPLEAQWHSLGYNPFKWFSQEKTSKSEKIIDKDKTKLLPIEWNGNISPVSDAWSTAATLTAGKLKVRGPFYGVLKTNKNGVKASLEYGDKNLVISQFEKTNKELKSHFLKNDLSKYPFLPKGYYHVFKDGMVVSEEEINKLNNLKDTTYLYTFFYKSGDGKSSLPGIFLIEKSGKFQHDKKLEDEATKVSGKPVKKDTLEGGIKKEELKEEKLDYKDFEKRLLEKIDERLKLRLDSLKSLGEKDYYDILEQIENSHLEIKNIQKYNIFIENKIDSLLNLYKQQKKIELPDTSKIIQKEREEDFDKRKLLLDEIYKLLLEKQKEGKITPKEKEDLERIIEERKKIPGLPAKKKDFDFGMGYEFNNAKYNGNLTLRYNLRNFIFGLESGYAEASSKKPDRIVVSDRNPTTGFRGEGIEKISEKKLGVYYGIEMGYNIGPLSLVLDAGVNSSNLITTREVHEQIRNRLDEIVAKNNDRYDFSNKTKKILHGGGIDLNLGSVKIGGRFIGNGKYNAKIKLFYSF